MRPREEMADLVQQENKSYWKNVCDIQEKLNWFKIKFKTYGAFNRYIVEKEKPEIEEYWKKRNKYLEGRKKILY